MTKYQWSDHWISLESLFKLRISLTSLNNVVYLDMFYHQYLGSDYFHLVSHFGSKAQCASLKILSNNKHRTGIGSKYDTQQFSITFLFLSNLFSQLFFIKHFLMVHCMMIWSQENGKLDTLKQSSRWKRIQKMFSQEIKLKILFKNPF